ncbi:MAG: anthranilate phosphoribosyltransferase [Nitrospinota bacterium]|jgi:anthranilate phosphoribosyltransferase|nr:anthranilate phosphoribosyltransferase [Nitrospinota bacterium]
MIKEALTKVVAGNHLSAEEAEEVMTEIMSGLCTPAQIAAYMTALRMKGETADEITGSARTMRAKATKIETKHDLVVDTAGTGGDGAHTFNISTTAALVAAGAGAPMAKHGNRAVSSHCGSADVLGALGVDIEISPERVGACLDEVGFAFLFAPALHASMKYAVGPRRETGLRSIFNVMGPLTNPAGSQGQIIGVYDASLTELMANVLNNLGAYRALVVHGSDGLDEITLAGKTRVSEVREGKVRTFDLSPEDLGLSAHPIDACKVTALEDNVRTTLMVLNGRTGPARDIVLLNAAAAIYVGGITDSMKDAVAPAVESIDSGAALAKLEAVKEFSRRPDPSSKSDG